MKKADFMALVGKNVEVILFDGEKITGKLFYVDEFSAKYRYRTPGYFGIEGSSWAFRFSHVEKVRLIVHEMDGEAMWMIGRAQGLEMKLKYIKATMGGDK